MGNFPESGKNGEVWKREWKVLPFALLVLNLFYLDLTPASFQVALSLSWNKVLVLEINRQTLYLRWPGEPDIPKQSNNWDIATELYYYKSGDPIHTEYTNFVRKIIMTYIGIALHSLQSLFTYVYYPVWSMHQACQPPLWVWPVLPMRNFVFKCPAHRRPAGKFNAGARTPVYCEYGNVRLRCMSTAKCYMNPRCRH